MSTPEFGKMVLKNIVIYPVKSLKGIELHESYVEDRGLAHDRRWMIVDKNYQFVTQRKHAKLCFIDIAYRDEMVILKHEGHSDLPLSHNGLTQEVEVTVWEDRCSALLGAEGANQWISEVLGFEAYFVYMHEGSERRVEQKIIKNDALVSFSDGYPILTLSEESMEGLNEKLEVALPIGRFRANLIVSGVGEAHEEDHWKEYTIGDTVILQGVKKCARCIFTAIDQSTGEKGKEPLTTLASYRKENNKIMFGMNAITNKTGKIKVGDIIEIKTRH